jgi:hypothetical protein
VCSANVKGAFMRLVCVGILATVVLMVVLGCPPPPPAPPTKEAIGELIRERHKLAGVSVVSGVDVIHVWSYVRDGGYYPVDASVTFYVTGSASRKYKLYRNTENTWRITDR